MSDVMVVIHMDRQINSVKVLKSAETISVAIKL